MRSLREEVLWPRRVAPEILERSLGAAPLAAAGDHGPSGAQLPVGCSACAPVPGIDSWGRKQGEGEREHTGKEYCAGSGTQNAPARLSLAER